MAKKKTSVVGKRLIASAKGMVAHAKGEIKLDTYSVRIPSEVDVLRSSFFDSDRNRDLRYPPLV